MSSERYHLVPITLVPVIIHLHQRQGVTALWKGLGSCLLVRGLSLAVEDVFTKFTPWPKYVFMWFDQMYSLKMVQLQRSQCQHNDEAIWATHTAKMVCFWWNTVK